MNGKCASEPVFCLPERAYRCYVGGALLERFTGGGDGTDGHFPEAWIASTTRACNGPGHPETEGLSRVRREDGTPGGFLADALARLPAGFFGAGKPAPAALPVLCKFLDSAIRLPIQCHPDRAFAKKHYRSEHGKSECWMVLGARRVGGKEPYLLMGFKPGITAEKFAALVRSRDSCGMAEALHKFPVRPGDAWYIPGRFPHAIGPGVFMLEVQEPSDWVVQPEAFCGDTPLSAEMQYGPLREELALECFSYRGESAEEVRERLCMRPETEVSVAVGVLERLADERYGRCFTVRRARVNGRLALPPSGWRLAINAGGAGELRVNGRGYAFNQADACLLPDGAEVELAAGGGKELTVYLAQT